MGFAFRSMRLQVLELLIHIDNVRGSLAVLCEMPGAAIVVE